MGPEEGKGQPHNRFSVVTVAPGRVEVQAEAQPVPAQGEVVVSTLATGLCGSDVHLFQGDHPYARYPLAQGHETVGRVAGVGPGVGTALEGALVVVEPTLECGSCGECLRGAYNRCERLEVIGVQRPGSLAGRFVTRAGKVHRVPEVPDSSTWALVEPMAVALHAVERSALQPGDTVLVLGAGVIGLGIALATRERSPGPVIVVEPNELRRQRVVSLGLGRAVQPTEAEEVLAAVSVPGADVVFEATGSAAVLSEAHNFARPGGQVVVVGQGPGSFSMPMIVMTRKELTLIGTRNSARDFPTAIELLSRSDAFVQSVITHRYDPAAAEEAYAELTRPQTDALKILLEFAW